MLNWLIKAIYLLVDRTLFSLFSKRIFWNGKYIPAFYNLKSIRPEQIQMFGLDSPDELEVFIPSDKNRCPEIGDTIKVSNMNFIVLNRNICDNWLVDNLRIKLICGMYVESKTMPKIEEVKSQEFSLKEFPSLANPYIPKAPEVKPQELPGISNAPEIKIPPITWPNINWSEISVNFPPEIKLDYNLPSVIDLTPFITDKIEFKPLMNNYHSYTASMPITSTTSSSSSIPSYILLNTVI